MLEENKIQRKWNRSTQFLTWIAIPLFMGYVDSGAFGTFARFVRLLSIRLKFILAEFEAVFVTI